MLIINRSYLAEVNFASAPAAGQRFFFGDIPALRTVFTHGIEAISASQLSTSPTGKTVNTQANCATLMLTLAIGDTEEVYQIPVTSLISTLNGGFIRQFNGKRINLPKSYVTSVTTGISANQSILFNFYYSPQPPAPPKIR